MLSWGVRLGTAAGAAACLLSLVACSDEDPGDAPEPKPDAASSASPDDDLSGLLGGEPAEEGPKDPIDAVTDAANARFALPDNAPPSAHQMVEQIAGTLTTYSVPMPTEAVGKGASWMVVDTVESNGITMTQTSTYVLEELDGDQYRISSEVDGTVDPVDLGGGVELVRGSLSGDGETVGAFGDLMPASGTSELSTTMVIEAAGRRAETVTDVDMTLTTELE